MQLNVIFTQHMSSNDINYIFSQILLTKVKKRKKEWKDKLPSGVSNLFPEEGMARRV